MTNNKPLEEQVIRDFLKGSHPAFRKVYDHYKGRITRLGQKRLRDKALVEEFVQDFLVILWTKRENIASAHVFDAYVFAMAKNLLVKHLQKMVGDRKGSVNLEHLRSHSDDRHGVESTLHEQDLDRAVNQAMDKLPPQQRLILELASENDLSVKEIAKTLNLALQTVNNHLHRARKKMRKLLYGK